MSITALCKGVGFYRVEVRYEVGTAALQYELRRGNLVISGPYTINVGETKVHDVPDNINGVKVSPIGGWRNGSRSRYPNRSRRAR